MQRCHSEGNFGFKYLNMKTKNKPQRSKSQNKTPHKRICFCLGKYYLFKQRFSYLSQINKLYLLQSLNNLRKQCSDSDFEVEKLRHRDQIMRNFYFQMAQINLQKVKEQYQKNYQEVQLFDQIFKDMRKQQYIFKKYLKRQQITLFTGQNSRQWKKGIHRLAKFGTVKQSSLQISKNNFKQNIRNKSTPPRRIKNIHHNSCDKSCQTFIDIDFELWENISKIQKLYLPEHNRALKKLVSCQQLYGIKQYKNLFKFHNLQLSTKYQKLFSQKLKICQIQKKEQQITQTINYYIFDRRSYFRTVFTYKPRK